MTKFAHPLLHTHSQDRLRRFEGHMDTVTMIAVCVLGLTMLAALLLPGSLAPW